MAQKKTPKAAEKPTSKPVKATASKKKAKPKPKSVPELEGLTYLQRMFVFFYLGEANGNASEAARMAGYQTPGVTGCRLLKKANIRAAIDAKLHEASLSTTETLARLAEIASIDAGDFLTIDKTGEPRVDLRRAKAARKLHLIKSVKPTKWGVSIELHDSLAALDRLARYHGLFNQDRDPPGVSVAEAIKAMLKAGQQFDDDANGGGDASGDPEGTIEVSE